MPEISPWLVAALAGATTAIAAVRGYIMQAWRWVEHHIVMTSVIRGDTFAIRTYIARHGKPSRFRPRQFIGDWEYFPNHERWELLFAEEIAPDKRSVYWIGWSPVLYEFVEKRIDTAHGSQSVEHSVVLRYFRGSLDIDKLLQAAKVEDDARRRGKNNGRENHGLLEGRRCFVIHIQGDDSPTQAGGIGKPSAIPGTGANQFTLEQFRPITHTVEYLTQQPESAIGRLFLCPAGRGFLADATAWRNNQEWYRSRQIPYRRGYGLVGAPGTGKTSIIRAFAEDQNLPVYIFDVGSLSNSAMTRYWRDMQSNTPCIAVIEDIDGVFNGRESVVQDGNISRSHVSFDCLLQCLDGIQRNHGVLVVVTTNKPESLDPALTRPGRIDRFFEFGKISEEHRRQMARRVLAELDLDIDKIVEEGADDTPAQFEGRCTAAALTKLPIEGVA